MRVAASAFAFFAAVAFPVAYAQSHAATTMLDDFSDGTADGWWLGFSHHTPWVNGNWRVEDGTLRQDEPGDAFIALKEVLEASSQSLDVDVWLHGPAGYGGATLWYQDEQNWTAVFLYPAGGGVWILQEIEGESYESRYAFLARESTWHRLAVRADATSGLIAVGVDGAYLFTHQTTGLTRSGRSGLYSGNSGGYFDNVQLTPLDRAPVFQGFVSPVENAPVLNVVRAGAGIPVKFSLGTFFGPSVIPLGFPVSRSVDCGWFTETDAIEQTEAPGASGLSYDADANQYTYVWKTDRSWTNTCREFVLHLNDGLTHIAYFQFSKK